MSRPAARWNSSVLFDFERVDPDVFIRLVLRVARQFRNLLDNIVTLDDFAEDAVAVVQHRCRSHSNKKLAAVSVRAGVSHGKETGLCVFQRRMKFVGELVTGTAAAGALRASALNHEVGNDAVEDEAI